MPAPSLRDLRQGDAAGVAAVCEATPYFSPPPGCLSLLPVISALPYTTLECGCPLLLITLTANSTARPDLAVILDDGHGNVVGYAIGCYDTASFIQRYRAEYRSSPQLTKPLVPDGSSVPTLDPILFPAPNTPAFEAEPADRRRMLGDLYRPERKAADSLIADGYPAHLHTNILPEYRGVGAGEKLVRTALAKMARRGVVGLHAHIATGNYGATRFWARLGFEKRSEEQAWVYVRRIVPQDALYTAAS